MRKTFWLAFSFLLMFQLLFTAVPTPSYACDCVYPKPPKEAMADAGAVYAGKVLKVEKLKEHFKVTFAVDTAWKGVASAETSVLTAIGGQASCGIDFEKGREYLVYTNQTPDGQMHASLCSRTKELQQADDDLKELGAGTKLWAAPPLQQTEKAAPPARQEEPSKQNAQLAFWAKGVWVVLAVVILLGAAIGLIKRKRGN